MNSLFEKISIRCNGAVRLFYTLALRCIPLPVRHRYDVAIVRHDGIGDFVMFLDALAAYRRRWTEKRILLVCTRQVEEIARRSGWVDEVLSFDVQRIARSLLYHLSFMIKMKHVAAGIVVNPSLEHQMAADEICSSIVSEVKIGTKIKRKGIKRRIYDRFFTQLVEMPVRPYLHELEAVVAFTCKVVDADYAYKLSDLSFLTKDFVAPVEGKYAVIALSASGVKRIWPVERVAEVIERIPREYLIVVTGYGQDDLQRVDYLKRHVKKHEIIDLVGKTSMVDVIRWVSKAAFVLGNDSATVHIAAACRVPSICYTPGAHYGRFLPYPDFVPEKSAHPRCVYVKKPCFQCNYHCEFVRHKDCLLPCIDEITVDRVVAELENLLREIA